MLSCHRLLFLLHYHEKRILPSTRYTYLPVPCFLHSFVLSLNSQLHTAVIHGTVSFGVGDGYSVWSRNFLLWNWRLMSIFIKACHWTLSWTIRSKICMYILFYFVFYSYMSCHSHPSLFNYIHSFAASLLDPDTLIRVMFSDTVSAFPIEWWTDMRREIKFLYMYILVEKFI